MQLLDSADTQRWMPISSLVRVDGEVGRLGEVVLLFDGFGVTVGWPEFGISGDLEGFCDVIDGEEIHPWFWMPMPKPPVAKSDPDWKPIEQFRLTGEVNSVWLLVGDSCVYGNPVYVANHSGFPVLAFWLSEHGCEVEPTHFKRSIKED